MNTNELHKNHYCNCFGNHREHPKSSGSLMLKSGRQTKKITQTQSKILMKEVKDGNYQGVAEVVIEFTDDKEANKIAKSFSRLADNPAFKLDVEFQKIRKS